MEEDNVPEQAFLSASRELAHGFSAVVCLRRGDFGVFDLWNDDFSTVKTEADGVTILVQAGTLSGQSARDIRERYIQNPEEYVPDRTTEGSFLIVDQARQRLVFGRDRSQVHHLYHIPRGDWLYLATNQVAFHGTLCHQLDALACDLYLTHGIVLAPFPLLKGLTALTPGQYVAGACPAGNDRVRLAEKRVFWNIRPAEVGPDYEKAVVHYERLLTENIVRHIRDSQAGVFLSGGSDSAAVVGVLNKLKCSQVICAHMAIPGFGAADRECVGVLERAYGCPVELVAPSTNGEPWSEQIDRAIRTSQLGSYVSGPAYALMGARIGKWLSPGSVVFNGELCLLDQGFTVVGDGARGLRRALYLGKGRLLSRMPPLLPSTWTIDWSKHRKPFYRKEVRADVLEVMWTALASFLHSLGRPSEYYGGAKKGFNGYPGLWCGRSLLPEDYRLDLVNTLKRRFFDFYESGLRGAHWRQQFASMTVDWYSEASNLTMPVDAAALARTSMCFPFSSTELMDFATSLPLPWCIDKRIQKDMCHRRLSMPGAVAYRLKDHRITGKTYFQAVYEDLRDHFLEKVGQTDYGPLQQGVNQLLALDRGDKKWNDQSIFQLYCLALYLEKSPRITP